MYVVAIAEERDPGSLGRRQDGGLLPAICLAAFGLLGAGLGAPALAGTVVGVGPAAGASQIVIRPITKVVPSPKSGFFSDPYPIRLAPAVSPFAPQFFSGTTKEILACPDHIVGADCIDLSSITVSPGALATQARASGSTITVSKTQNIFEDDTGAFHMAMTFQVSNPAFPGVPHWNVIVHAHPTNQSDPTSWVADTLLVGSFSQPAKADYDGKYFEDSGRLYLIYSKPLTEKPAALHDGIVAQPMVSFTQPAAVAPTILLEPDDANGGLNSEYFFGLPPRNGFKLVETGNITKINGKYALAYSTGAFDEIGYKAGVAWSDTLLPAPGTFYRKVLQQDTQDVWGQPDHLEVRYLLQSQESAWPNYVASQVQAPGVPSIVKDPDGAYHLFFAGYAPLVQPDPGTGDFHPADRQPYVVKLQVDIPAGATVASTSDANLAGWLQPITQ